MDEVYGDGDAELEESRSFSDEIRFVNGGDSSFTAKPW
jgi:hypothetical protein